MTVRTRLLLLVLACVIPLCAVGAGLAHHLVRSHQDALREDVVERLRLASTAIDLHLAQAEAALEVMAASLALEDGDLRRFHAEVAGAAEAAASAWR